MQCVPSSCQLGWLKILTEFESGAFGEEITLRKGGQLSSKAHGSKAQTQRRSSDN
jgi:hypothetical protein